MPLPSELLGTTLGGRYRLESVLGTGASAIVFLAHDTTLERRVAIKLLQPALAEDQAFLKRFRAEARSVAALNHPNVLRVFDWGEQDGVPYLVTELLAGGSLKDLLDAGVRLSHEQAASVGEQAAAGLAYAHARGLVHRDVKPANLLFDDEGRVRVTDFGVARALAEASWTEPAGAMIGTVRYASPEQAEGLSVDGKADVYSLSLVLFEALSGVVPFAADTPVATLRARVGQPLPHDPSLGSLDIVLAQAASPDHDTRLDAATFEQRLSSLASTLPPPMPIPIQIHGELNASQDDGEQFRAPTVDELTMATPVVQGGRSSSPSTPFDGDADQDRTVVGQPRETLARPRKRRWPWVVAISVILALLGAGFAVVAVSTKLFVPNVTVPKVKGDSVEQARKALASAHLEVVFQPSVFSITIPDGHVILQQPKAGTVLKQGSTIRIVASRGLPPVTVPSFAGLDCAAAQAALTTVHLTGVCPPEAATFSATVPLDQVISYRRAGVENPPSVSYGSSVKLIISKGPPPVPVPQVSGTFAQAESILVGAGFKVTQAQEFSTTVPSGQVTRTSPVVGTPIQKDTTVTVFISQGPPLQKVPDLTGKTVASATRQLSGLGLRVGAVYGPPGGRVFQTSPASGTPKKVGSIVNLYVR